jgi:hypothetical protein
MGLEVGGLGPVQVAAEAAQLPELVVALGGAGHVQVGEVPADQGGLPLGLSPGALALQDLAAVDAADAGEQHGRREGGQPAARRLGPLGRPAHVGQLGEGGHQVAVDVAGVLRGQLAGEHRQHGLVQQGHPLGHAAPPDQHSALEQVPGGRQVGVGVAAADLPDPPGHGRHGRGVVALQSPLQLQVQEVAVGDALRLVPDQPLGSAQPARPDHAVAAQQVVHGDPDGGHGRPAGPAVVQVAAVGDLEHGRRLLDLAQPPGRVGQGVQVGGGELAGGPGGGEALAGARPVASTVGLPGRLQDLAHPVHGRPPQVVRMSLPSLPPAAKRS